METRKAPDDKEKHPNAKRQRLLVGRRDTDDVSSVDTAVTFDSLNNDCLVHIFSYLQVEEMNVVAICSKDCRTARSNESLDQTRTGTIVWTDTTTLDSFIHKIQQSINIFTGNRTHMKIMGLDKSRAHLASVETTLPELSDRLTNDRIPLEHVKRLECGDTNVNHNVELPLIALFLLLPNLQEIDLNSVPASSHYAIVVRLYRACHFLRKLKWNGCKNVHFCGVEFQQTTHLYIDGGHFAWGVLSAHHIMHRPPSTVPNSYLLMKCTLLECLSLKGATMVEEGTHTTVALPQETLINMVRHHPTLRWLRSDLTTENVAMLKRERPNITFVSE